MINAAVLAVAEKASDLVSVHEILPRCPLLPRTHKRDLTAVTCPRSKTLRLAGMVVIRNWGGRPQPVRSDRGRGSEPCRWMPLGTGGNADTSEGTGGCTAEHAPARAVRMRRRDLLGLIGAAAGGSAMYLAMSALGHAAESTYTGPIKLDGDPRGASVLVLGAGGGWHGCGDGVAPRRLPGRIAEINDRPGGRTWTIRGGDQYTELGGAVQECGFDAGLYKSTPGPWRNSAVLTGDCWTTANGWAWRWSRSRRSITTMLGSQKWTFVGTVVLARVGSVAAVSRHRLSCWVAGRVHEPAPYRYLIVLEGG